MPTDDDVIVTSRPRAGSRLAAGTPGVLSVVLLGAAFRWAHHRGPLADTVVALWAAATLAGIATAVLAARWRLRGFVLAGLVGTIISVSVFLMTTAAYATGHDPVAACGGG